MIEKIGIVGGGQLGRMLTEAALPLGFEVTVLDPGENCPAAQVGARQIVGGLKDSDAIADLVEQSDVTTWEIEHIGVTALQTLVEAGHNIQPAPRTLGVISNKLEQKRFLRDHGLPVTDFRDVIDTVQLGLVQKRYPNGFIIKTIRGGYDGRGNTVLRDVADANTFNLYYETRKKLGLPDTGLKFDMYAEELIDFEKELAIIAARDVEGNTAIYPVVETIHKDNICHVVLSPAEIDPDVRVAADEIARETLKHLEGAGVFAIEMFQSDKDVIINEIAPRVHNSGHHTIEANVTSQFEQHIRAITGLPLGSVATRAAAAVMINVLGRRDEPFNNYGIDKILALPDAHVHFYGKAPRPERKIGHITLLGSSTAELREIGLAAREELAI